MDIDNNSEDKNNIYHQVDIKEKVNAEYKKICCKIAFNSKDLFPFAVGDVNR